jgi:hypothetical protein
MDPEIDRRDKWELKPGDVVLTQCVSCARAVDGSFGRVCPAFPGGIPDDIVENRFDHRQPHPDEVVPKRFEPRADADPAVLDALYRTLDAL